MICPGFRSSVYKISHRALPAATTTGESQKDIWFKILVSITSLITSMFSNECMILFANKASTPSFDVLAT